MLLCQVIVPSIPSPYKGFVSLWTRNDGCSSVDTLKPRSASPDPDSNRATAAKLQQRSLRVLRSSEEPTLQLISAKEERNEKHSSCCTLPLHLTSVITHLILIWHKSEEKPRQSTIRPVPRHQLHNSEDNRSATPRCSSENKKGERENIHSQPWICQGERRKSWGL